MDKNLYKVLRLIQKYEASHEMRFFDYMEKLPPFEFMGHYYKFDPSSLSFFANGALDIIRFTSDTRNIYIDTYGHHPEAALVYIYTAGQSELMLECYLAHTELRKCRKIDTRL